MRAFLAILGVMVAAMAVAIMIAFVRPNNSTPERSPETYNPPPAQPVAKMMDPKDAAKGALRADLQIEGRGLIVLELYPAAAPKTVAHFVDLCSKHFYDGILVHRVESNPEFKLFQAGDPTSKSVKPEQLRPLARVSRAVSPPQPFVLAPSAWEREPRLFTSHPFVLAPRSGERIRGEGGRPVGRRAGPSPAEPAARRPLPAARGEAQIALVARPSCGR